MTLSFLSFLSTSISLSSGLLYRLNCLFLAWALFILIRQVKALGGRKGMHPVTSRLHRMYSDYGLKCVIYFPTWLWLAPAISPFFRPSLQQERLSAEKNKYASSRLTAWQQQCQIDMCQGYLPPCLSVPYEDDILPALVSLGTIAAITAFVIGGMTGKLCFIFAWSVYLSLVNTIQLVIFPWDYLLCEMTFLNLFMPSVHPIWTHWETTYEPSPILYFSFRFLLFRLMFGFGKFKFIGASLKEFSYLHGFMVNLPLPSVFGLIIHRLPLLVHILGLIVFFISEIIVPFFFFSASYWRLLGCLLTIKLQIAIQFSGSFGFFNLLSAALCTSLLNIHASIGDFSLYTHLLGIHNGNQWSILFTCWSIFSHLILFTLLLLSPLYILFNSWATMSFPLWPSINFPLTNGGHFLRFISNYHIIHAYGIFFPHSSPPVRWVPVIEGREDENKTSHSVTNTSSSSPSSPSSCQSQQWEQYLYRFQTVRTDVRPYFCSPFHFRFDQSIFYDGIGLTPDTFHSSLSSGSPYDFMRDGTLLERAVICLLQGNTDVQALFRYAPFAAPAALTHTEQQQQQQQQQRCVKELRLSLYAYTCVGSRSTEHTSLSTSNPDDYYHRRFVCPQSSQLYERERVFYGLQGKYLLFPPEAYHPDMFMWQQKAQTLLPLTQIIQFTQLQANQINVLQPNLHIIEFQKLYESQYQRKLTSKLITTLYTKETPHASETTFASASLSSLSSLYSSCCEADVDSFWNVFLRDLQAHTSKYRLSQLHDITATGQAITNSVQDYLSSTATVNKCMQYSQTQSPQLPSHLHVYNLAWIEEKQYSIFCRLKQLLLYRILPFYHGPSSSDSQHPDENGVIDQDLSRPSSSRSKCVDCMTKGKHICVRSFFHLHLFVSALIFQGPVEYERCLNDPFRAVLIFHQWRDYHVDSKDMTALRLSNVEFAQDGGIAMGLILYGVFFSRLLAYHSVKARLVRHISFSQQRERGGLLPGWLHIVYEYLPYMFLPEQCKAFELKLHEARLSCQRQSNSSQGPESNFSHSVCLHHPQENWPIFEMPQRWDAVWKVDITQLPLFPPPALVPASLQHPQELPTSRVVEPPRIQQW